MLAGALEKLSRQVLQRLCEREEIINCSNVIWLLFHCSFSSFHHYIKKIGIETVHILKGIFFLHSLHVLRNL